MPRRLQPVLLLYSCTVILINSEEALKKVLTLPFFTVLDLGAGEGKHSQVFRQYGKEVTELRYEDGDYMGKLYPEFDCIWASHVLEHVLNPHYFLRKCFTDLKEDGILAVTVPPAKSEIVGGHVSIWNAGLLLYHMILAGFDCSSAMVKTYGYNISVIVRKKKAVLPALSMDFGDIEKLSHLFPFEAKHGFNGEIQEINW